MANGRVVLTNASIHTSRHTLANTSIVCEGGRIAAITSEVSAVHASDVVIDCTGLRVAPGFIDLHLHGFGGRDSREGTAESITSIAAACTRFGVTAIVPTLTVLSDENWRISSRVVRDAMRTNGAGAHILGIHMEGPFLSPKNKGGIFGGGLAQPSLEILDKCFEFCGDALRIMTLAPELEGATAVIEQLLEHGVVVSVGHSGASYDHAAAAFRLGCRHVTHLFNGMPGVAARDPGVVAAALLDDTVYVEVIADGHHVAVPNIQAVLRVKPRDKVCLVTDACKACGTNLTGFDNPSGFHVEIRDGRTWGPDDKLVGSVLTLDQALRNVLSWTSLSLNDALGLLTENPARQLGIYPKKGEIAVGSDADFALLDHNTQVAMTIVGGEVLYRRDAA